MSHPLLSSVFLINVFFFVCFYHGKFHYFTKNDYFITLKKSFVYSEFTQSHVVCPSLSTFKRERFGHSAIYNALRYDEGESGTML